MFIRTIYVPTYNIKKGNRVKTTTELYDHYNNFATMQSEDEIVAATLSIQFSYPSTIFYITSYPTNISVVQLTIAFCVPQIKEIVESLCVYAFTVTTLTFTSVFMAESYD